MQGLNMTYRSFPFGLFLSAGYKKIPPYSNVRWTSATMLLIRSYVKTGKRCWKLNELFCRRPLNIWFSYSVASSSIHRHVVRIHDTFQHILETLAMNHLWETCISPHNWMEVKHELQLHYSSGKHYNITEFSRTWQ